MSILILRLSALGDVIHTFPAVEEMRAALPAARMVWVVERPYAEMVAAVAPVDEVISVATRRWRKTPTSGETWAELGALRRTLRKEGGGAAVDFQGLAKSASLGWIAGAKARFSFDRHSIREPAALLFSNRRIAVEPGLHVVDINRALARGVVADLGGTPVPGSAPDLQHFAADLPGELVGIVDDETVVFLPGAGKPAKQWNIDSFRALATTVTRDLRLRVLVAWGPGEEDLARGVVKEGEGTMAPPTNLRQLAFLLSRSRLVVGGDTGPLHLAAALGTDVVGLYGPTDPRRNGPYGQIDRCVTPEGGRGTMDAIDVESVAARVREILE
ncbi:MAG TPA: lipopolysaccharide heptosyltransferase I [Thermoanaerobaculia bacterium]|nr:lipopolysaccharide heptosyltransferase I [Thermoanaerobaculia bacterium]